MKNIVYAGLILSAITLAGIGLPSCKKTVTRTVMDTVNHAWQVVPLFNSYGQPALSSYNLGDSILSIGGNWQFVNMPVRVFNNPIGYFLPGATFTQPAFEAPYLDNAAVSYTTATSLYVESNPPHSQFSVLTYTPKYTPGEYNRFQQAVSYPTLSYPAAAYPLIRDHYVLTPVETMGAGGYKQARFDLISFDSVKVLSPMGFGDTPHIRSITVTADPSTIGFSASNYFCAVYYDKFFVGYGNQFFRIDTAGNVKSFGYTPVPRNNSYGIYNMFTVGNTLFLNSGGIMFSSTDEGETWSLFNDFSGTTVGRVIFRNVGKDLYATLDDLDMQLWKVVLDGNAFNFSELNNDGLQSNLLTSLTRCGRYIFATTLTGVFYRDTAFFNQLRYPIR